ncbi:MAG: ABC transporter permease [Trueperaceae bacterium]|nr:ABC transporter permease [Trueperaceae bacterium]
MASYLLRRLLVTFPTLLGVSVLVFLSLHLAPGDPALVMLGPKATATSLEALRTELGLDRPLHVQYLRWIGGVVSGDWGRSIQLRAGVLPLVWERFQATLILAVVAMLIAVGIGIALGVVSAVVAGSLLDRTAITTTLIGYSLPPFFLGIVLQVVLGLRMGWFPVTGMYPAGGGDFGDLLMHLVLPAVTLAAGIGALLARMTRATMLEVLRQDYVRTAQAKGLTRRVVVLQHAFRNALIPILTIVGLQTGYVLGGAVLVEQVFSWPGIGTLAINAILARDFPLVQGVTLMAAGIYVFTNLLTDVAYTLVDPRISYQ